jgi:hypothetical protein
MNQEIAWLGISAYLITALESPTLEVYKHLFSSSGRTRQVTFKIREEVILHLSHFFSKKYKAKTESRPAVVPQLNPNRASLIFNWKIRIEFIRRNFV